MVISIDQLIKKSVRVQFHQHVLCCVNSFYALLPTFEKLFEAYNHGIEHNWLRLYSKLFRIDPGVKCLSKNVGMEKSKGVIHCFFGLEISTIYINVGYASLRTISETRPFWHFTTFQEKNSPKSTITVFPSSRVLHCENVGKSHP